MHPQGGIPGFVAVALAAALIVPAVAVARVAPAIEQYVEHVPAVPNDKPTYKVVGHPSGFSLPPGAAAALNELGAAGERAATVAQQTAPEHERARTSDGGVAGEEGLAAVFGSLFDPPPGGMGFLFPLVLIGSTIAATAFALRRRPGRSHEPDL